VTPDVALLVGFEMERHVRRHNKVRAIEQAAKEH